MTHGQQQSHRADDGTRAAYATARSEPRPALDADAAESPRTLPPLRELQFPGCAAVPMTRAGLEAYEGRLEFWDADAATAWVAEPPVTAAHERPSHALAALAERIAQARGSPIVCLGALGLVVRDADGARRRVMQADQSLYLRPLSANVPGDEALTVGGHDLPDVVLEVDHTTDARRGKLALYEEWGFPELWIQVPGSGRGRGRRRGRRRPPGLTIHLLEGGRYRVAGESRAFPGFTAAEIHAALDEKARSAETLAVLDRVGATLGALEGTGPDDDPQLRWHMERGRTRGRAEGLAEGRAEGLEHERRLLVGLAARRFGVGAGERLSALLSGVTEPELLEAVGNAIIDCGTGAELLATAVGHAPGGNAVGLEVAMRPRRD